MNGIANRLLAHLEGMRQTGPDRWMACCPAHNDRNPSLSIALTADGRILLNCFAGCSFDDVIRASGLAIRDLLPTSVPSFHAIPGRRESVSPEDALTLASHEIFAATLVIETLTTARELHPALLEGALDRLRQACQRMNLVRSFLKESAPAEIAAIRRGNR